MQSFGDEHINDYFDVCLSEFPTNVPRYDTCLNTNANVRSDAFGDYNSNFQPSEAVAYDCAYDCELNQEPRTFNVGYYYHQFSPDSNSFHHQTVPGLHNTMQPCPSTSGSNCVNTVQENSFPSLSPPTAHAQPNSQQFWQGIKPNCVNTIQENSFQAGSPPTAHAQPNSQQYWQVVEPGTSRTPQSPADTMSLPPQSTPASQICAICEDKATGKHYGAPSCDGCKGFFRRSVRKNHHYTCRFSRDCIVDKDKRNQCRFCRMRKCITAGMKTQAVQNERDSISSSRKTNYEMHAAASGVAALTALQADAGYKQEAAELERQRNSRRVANVENIFESMRTQLSHFLKWHQCIRMVGELTPGDQVALLRAGAGPHLILGVARRSMFLNVRNAVLLGNNYVIQRSNANGSADNRSDVNGIVVRVLEELVKPFEEMNFDHQEFACLRAILFFEPSTRNLQNRERVRLFRHQIQCYLEEHVGIHHQNIKGRLGELLLALPTLRSISGQMFDRMLWTKVFGITDPENFLERMLFGNPNQNPVVNQLTSVNQNGLPQPTSANHNGLQQPTSVNQNGLQQPTSVNQNGLQQPTSINQNGLQQPTSVNQNGLQFSQEPSPPAIPRLEDMNSYQNMNETISQSVFSRMVETNYSSTHAHN